jgi:Glycosyltransferase 61
VTAISSSMVSSVIAHSKICEKIRRKDPRTYKLSSVVIIAAVIIPIWFFYVSLILFSNFQTPEHFKSEAWTYGPSAIASDPSHKYNQSSHNVSSRIVKREESEDDASREKVNTDLFSKLPPSDGMFNDLPLYYKTKPIYSTYSCVGENFRNDAWLFRSCHFRNLCFDVSNRSFVLFQSKQDQILNNLQLINKSITHLSSIGTLSVSLGGINPKWGRGTRSQLEWFPRLQFTSPPDGYYELPPNTVWVPFHSFAGYNVGHLIWDDFFPIYKLLQMFDLLDHQNHILTKLELKLWGACDWNPKRKDSCVQTLNKFQSAMGVDRISSINSTDHDFQMFGLKKSRYICSPHGAAGLGMLTDHGLKMHGWDEEDWQSTYNAGRGHIFYNFRNFMLHNLKIPVNTDFTPPYQIYFSRFSSSTQGRVKGFQKQEHALKRALNNRHNVTIAGERLSRLSLHEQAEIASKTAIFITVVGGGSMTATFLPRGASLILFYEAKGGRKRDKDTGLPARLDWDLLNHASHLRVHWFPIESSDDPGQIDLLSKLVIHELDIIKHLS